MKQLADDFFTQVALWDKKHRIIGKEDPRTLWDQSIEALEPLLELRTGETLIDVGAGSGLLGFPWLSLNPINRAVFIEMAPKKIAFITQFLSQHNQLAPRSLVIMSRLEDVSRETLAGFMSNKAFMAFRAFDGPSIGSAIKNSQLGDLEAMVFKKSKDEGSQIDRFVLNRV